MHVQWGWGPGLGIYEVLAVIAMIVFWALVIALLVLAVRWLIRADRRDGASPSQGTREDALEILRQRYARGEIDDEEYERRRRTLVGP